MKKNILHISLIVAAIFFCDIEAKASYTIHAILKTALSTPTPTGAGTVYVQEGSGPTQSTSGKDLISYDSGHPQKKDGGYDTEFYFKLEAKSEPGYHFTGWYKEADASKDPISTDSKYTYHMSNTRTAQSEEASVWGDFAYNTYTVTYVPNGGTGSMASSNFTYLSDSNILRKNTYSKTATITYNTQGGNPITPGKYTQEFKNWSSSIGEEYADEANLKDLITDDGATVELSAQWQPVSVTLPTPTKTDGGSSVEFRGWYDAPGGGKLVGAAGTTAQLPGDATLYALWNDGYTITINVRAEGFSEGQSAVFSIKNPSSSVNYTVPIVLSSDSKVTLSGVPVGTYTVAPIGWSWDFTSTPTSITREVSSDTEFSFVMKSKGSNTVHDEKFKKNIWQN